MKLKEEVTERSFKQKEYFTDSISQQIVDLMTIISEQKAQFTKSIYFVGLVQFLAIISCTIGVFSFYLSNL